MATIYILSSDRSLSRYLRLALTLHGYHVQDDCSAPDVLRRLQEEKTPESLVLFGEYLPQLGVQPFLQRLLAQPELTQRHRFLLLSTQAHALPPALDALVQQTHIPVLGVPCSPDALTARLRGLLHRRDGSVEQEA